MHKLKEDCGGQNAYCKSFPAIALAGDVIKAVPSEKLLGQTIFGLTRENSRWKRVADALRLLHRVALLPLPVAQRLSVAALLAVPKVGYHLWAHVPNRAELSKWRAAMRIVDWKHMPGWISPAAFVTCIAALHRADLPSMSILQSLKVARRVSVHPAIKSMIQEQITMKIKTGPLAKLIADCQRIGCHLLPDGQMQYVADGVAPQSELSLWSGDHRAFEHAIRELLRDRVWSIAKPRIDSGGSKCGIQVDVSAHFLRSVEKKFSPVLVCDDHDDAGALGPSGEASQLDSHLDDCVDSEGVSVQVPDLHLSRLDGELQNRPMTAALLRIILTGSTHTAVWWHKACSHPTPTCVHCSAAPEDLFHIYWECSAFSKVRASTMWTLKWSCQVSHPSTWPRCLSTMSLVPKANVENMGVVPQIFLDDKKAAVAACRDLQMHMASVLCCRAQNEMTLGHPHREAHLSRLRISRMVPSRRVSTKRRPQDVEWMQPSARKLRSEQSLHSCSADSSLAIGYHLSDDWPSYPEPERSVSTCWITPCVQVPPPVDSRRDRPWSSVYLEKFVQYVNLTKWVTGPLLVA